MYRISRHAVATTVAALMAVTLAACTPGGSDPVASDSPENGAPQAAAKVQPGDCLSDQLPNANLNFDADLGSVVDCGEASHYLVYAVLDIDAEFLPAEGASEEDVLAQRESVTLNTGADFAAFHLAARKACSAEFVEQSGLGSVDVMGASAADVIAEPSGNFYTDITASSEDEWLAGDYYFACSLGWEESDKSTTAAVLGSGVTIADFLTPAWPVELRRCTQWVGDGTENLLASCSEPHWMEHSVQIDPWTVLGEDARAALDVDAADEEAWLELDSYCAAFTSSFTGDAASADDYWSTAVWVNWEGDDKVPTSVVCGFSVIDSETVDVVGSLVGIGAGTPETVAIPAE